MQTNKIRLLDISLITYIVSVFLFTLNAKTTYISELVLLFYILLLVFDHLTKRINFSFKYISLFLPLLIFAIITLFLSTNTALAFEKVQTLFLLIVLFTTVYNTYDNDGNWNYILWGLLLSGTIVSVVVIYSYGFLSLKTNLLNGVRTGREIFQLSYLGRFTYIAAIVAFFMAYYKEIKILYILYFICGFICLVSESRQSVITLIVGTTLLYLMKSFTKKKLKVVLRIVALICVTIIILRLSVFKALTNRIIIGLTLQSQEFDLVSDVKRLDMIKQGFDAFIHNPLLGIGLGCSREILTGSIADYKYLHNNYVELLCCGGVIGFVFYYMIYYYLFKKIIFIKSFGITSHEIIFSQVLLICQLISDMFAVNYYSKLQYLIFLYCFITIEKTINDRSENMEWENF